MSPTFAEALKKARLGKGWTQAQLAEKVGICVCTLYKYEKGDYEDFNIFLLISNSIGGVMEDKKTWDEIVQEIARCLKEKEKDGGVASEIIKEQEKKIKMLRIFSGIAIGVLIGETLCRILERKRGK